MPDFKAHVKQQLRHLAPDATLVEELAQDLEDRYQALLHDGSPTATAWRDANEQMGWPKLASQLSTEHLNLVEAPGGRGVLIHFFRDLRYGFRQLMGNPGFAATAILILGVSIGANTAIFSAFEGLVLHPLPYRDPDQLVKITEDFKKFSITGMQLAALELDDLRAMTSSFSHIAGIASGEFTLTEGEASEAVPGLRVSASLFPLLQVKPILGSPFRDEDEAYGSAHRVVVISEGFWRRRFGADPNIIGATIQINRESYRVAAVSPPILDYLGTSWDLWVPLSFQPKDREPATRGGKWVDVVARLKPGATVVQAEQELAAVTTRLSTLYPKAYPKEVGFSLHATSLASSVAGNLRQPLLFLLAAVGILMLIACANVSNLLIVRASVRRRELSIRAALGASPLRVFCQLMAESAVVATLAGLVGVAIAFAILKLFELYAPSYLNLLRVVGLEINGWVLAFTIGVSTVASLLFGLLPALTASSDLTDRLKESGRGGTAQRRRVRELMVALEVAASLVLLICAGLLIRSFVRVQQSHPGFEAGHVLTFELFLPPAHYPEAQQRIALYEALRSRIERLPGVVHVGAADRIPFGGRQGGSPLRVVGRVVDPNAPQPMLRPSRVLPGYFESLGIRLLRGRYFAPADTTHTPAVAIIDEATARKFFPNGEDPLGVQITGVERDLTATIVGVVGSVKRSDLTAPPDMSVYHAATQKAGSAVTYTVKTTTDPLTLISAIRHELHAVDPLLPLTRTVTMDQRLSDSLARRRISMHLMMFFGVAALLLAATGLYGVLSYVVDQRRREVGIRVALGAPPIRVIGMLAKEGFLPVALGIAAGLSAATAIARLLTTMLYPAGSNDLLVYLMATGLLILTTAAAIAVPARRAATADPVAAIREE